MSNQDDHTKKEIDDVTGVETTGHEWDGLKELNNPLPRWWLWVFLVTVIWAMWYFVAYPSWPVPGGATKGTTGYTQFKELAENQKEIADRQAAYLEKFESASFQDIMDDPELYAFANAGGATAFKDNCATCHGGGAQGGKGYPNLNDDDWLWGGTLDDIHLTIQHGIRSADEDTHFSQMPAFGKDSLLSRNEIEAVVDYVLTLSGGEHKESYVKGSEIFQTQCASCHGQEGKGDHSFGAPNLTDKIWLYGGDRQNVYHTVYNSRSGVMPAWQTRLDENTIRQLTVYIHQLGGGEADAPAADIPAAQTPAIEVPENTEVETP